MPHPKKNIMNSWLLFPFAYAPMHACVASSIHTYILVSPWKGLKSPKSIEINHPEKERHRCRIPLSLQDLFWNLNAFYTSILSSTGFFSHDFFVPFSGIYTHKSLQSFCKPFFCPFSLFGKEKRKRRKGSLRRRRRR